MGAIHSTKISGNFSLKLNGSVRTNRKSFEKVVHLSRWSSFFGWTGPIEPIPTHSQSQVLAVRYLPFTKWRKILIIALLYGLLTADLSVFKLVHPCTVTTGL